MSSFVVTALALFISAIAAVATALGIAWAKGRWRAWYARTPRLESVGSTSTHWLVHGIPSVVRNAAAVTAGCLVTVAFGLAPSVGLVVLVTSVIAAWDLWRLSFERRAVMRGLGGVEAVDLGSRLRRDSIIRLTSGLIGAVLAAGIWIRWL
jgi:hypothetical protein